MRDDDKGRRVTELEAHCAAMRAALERINKILTVPAAEYIPAIADCFPILEAALSTDAGRLAADVLRAAQEWADTQSDIEGYKLMYAIEAWEKGA